jgi:pimeloyl-ACP methyl ester carboxylesterase
MQTVNINDIEMYYEVHGDEEPLVLLHGFFCTGRDWDFVVPEYAEHFHLIIPDLRGHGKTTNPTKEFTHKQAALDIFALLDELEIKQIKGIGFSTGGMTLLHMATQQPERVETMVLDCATPYFPKECIEYWTQQTVERAIEERKEFLFERHIRGEEQIRQLCQQWIGMKDDFDDMSFTPPNLSTITAKTLIAHGDRDPFFPARIALYMYDAIPNSYLWIVPNCGHTLTWNGFDEALKKTALDFLTGKWETS